jgi:hypothetical protein
VAANFIRSKIGSIATMIIYFTKLRDIYQPLEGEKF